MVVDLFFYFFQSQRLELHVTHQLTSITHRQSPLLPALIPLLSAEVLAKLANLFHN